MREVMIASNRVDKPTRGHEIKVGARILVERVFVPGVEEPLRAGVEILIGDDIHNLDRYPIPIEKDTTVLVVVPFECEAVYLSGVTPEERDVCLNQMFDAPAGASSSSATTK